MEKLGESLRGVEKVGAAPPEAQSWDTRGDLVWREMDAAEFPAEQPTGREGFAHEFN